MSEKFEIEMTSQELQEKVNAILDVAVKGEWTPLQFLFVLTQAKAHIENEHGLRIQSIDFEKHSIN